MNPWLQRPSVALALLALGMAVIPLNDALIKLMSANLPLFEITFIRGLIVLGFMLVFSKGFTSMLRLPAWAFWQFFGRGLCLVVAMGLFFFRLGTLSLSMAVAIFFVSPLLITLLSVPLLGEKIGFHRLLSVFMGMVGVLVIIRPGSDSFQIETVIVFGSALAYALFQIWTRRLKAVGDLPALTMVQHLAYVLASAPILLINWLIPRAPSDNMTLDFMLRAPVFPGQTELVYIFICSLSVLLLSLVSSNAYRSAEASIIAPFEYTAVPFSVVWGIIIWQDWPDFYTLFGTGLILVGGLYTVYRERVQNVEVMSAAPMPASASASSVAISDVEDQRNQNEDGPDIKP